MKNAPTNVWRKRAAKLAAAIPRSALHGAVLDWAKKSPASSRWGVAFSGGSDSLALLLLVWAHWPERRRGLVAFHFNHRLRGRDSNADEAFCQRVCGALGVAFVSGRWAGARADASEAAARKARFFFFGEALPARKVKALWFGHQQDDVAESMLMRLARGSGSAGLAAPRPAQTFPDGRAHLRPLLALKKKRIEEALRDARIAWRRDASNDGSRYFRNRLRRSVIPAWCKSAEGRDPIAGAAITRELLDEDDRALECWVDRLAPVTPAGSLSLAKLRAMPRAVWRRALQRWLAAHDRSGTLSRQGFTALLHALERGAPTRQSLGADGFARIRNGLLRFEAAPRTGLEKSARIPLPPN